MKRLIEKARIISFSATLLTTIPLFINYLRGIDFKDELIVYLHIWFGAIFFVFAILSMIVNKKDKEEKK